MVLKWDNDAAALRQHFVAKAQALGQEARGRGEGANVTDVIQDMRKEDNCHNNVR
jgi:hypothetical protein